MSSIKKWIFKENSTKSTIIWNSLAGGINAGQAAIILVVVSHKLDIYVAGCITIAYAIANLIITIGKYGIRNYQVTDRNCKYTFSDYLNHRIIMMIVISASMLVYIILCRYIADYSEEKVAIIIEVYLLKLVDVVEDVIGGELQQCGRLDIAAKIMAIRLIITTFMICVMVLCGCNIHSTLVTAIFVSIVLLIFTIKLVFEKVKEKKYSVRFKKVLGIFRDCFPLCIGSALAVYVGNAPKYLIDVYMNEETQAKFGYIMMPVFVVMLLNQFIYQPIIKDMSDIWGRGEKSKFKSKVIKHCLVILGLTLFIIIVGLIVGLPILAWLYNTNLMNYNKAFAILLLGGGFYAVANYMIVPITIIREQRILAFGYGIATIVNLLLGKFFLSNMGMLGAALLYLIINIGLVVFYLSFLLIIVKLEMKKDAI